MNNNGNAYYVLMNDIDCSDTVNWNSGAGFVPIGEFTGTFNGQGHKITGLFINRLFSIGLFGGTIGSGAIIKNVGLVDVNITGSGYPGGSNFIGGLAAGNNGTIINCYATGSVRGDLRIGGLVGWNAGGGTITNSYATASVTGIYHVGGLVGANVNGGTITNSYATGRVTGSYLVGGLVGTIWYDYYGIIINSYWDIETSGQSGSAGGTGKTTAEMMQQSTYGTWDFVNIWAIDEGLSYPYLQGQIPPVVDSDSDGILDDVDNCPNIANPDQADMDEDGIGDVCDIDKDGDGVNNDMDNCPLKVNTGQEDNDNDGLGDVCDPDDDNDGVLDVNDLCPFEDARGFDADSDGCIDTAAGLQQVVNTLPDEVLSDEIKNSLASKVDNALRLVDEEKYKAAINMLGAFINQVKAQKGKKISEEAADMLIAYANNVIVTLLSKLGF